MKYIRSHGVGFAQPETQLYNGPLVQNFFVNIQLKHYETMNGTTDKAIIILLYPNITDLHIYSSITRPFLLCDWSLPLDQS